MSRRRFAFLSALLCLKAQRSAVGHHLSLRLCLPASMASPSFSLPCLLLVVALFMAASAGVLAQNGTYFSHFLDEMNASGFTDFTAWVHEAGADVPSSPFYQTISSVPSYTLFIPNNDAWANPSANFLAGTFQNNNPVFMNALLSYHLLPGIWSQSQLGAGYNHSILPTTLEADPPTLEDLLPQQLVCGYTSNGLEIFNQVKTTTVLETFQYDSLIIHVIPAVIAPPPTYDVVAKNYLLNQFEALRLGAGIISPALTMGFTAFVPSDDAFVAAKAALAGTDPKAIYNAHFIAGQSVWTSLFGAGPHTASSNATYTFGVSSTGYTVTLNGVTANIIQSDILTVNGVVHVIDRVLVAPQPANATADTGALEPTSTDGAPATGASSVTALPTPTGPTTTASNTAQQHHTLTAGAVAAIVGIALVLLSLPLVALYIAARRRRARRRSQSSGGSVFDLPSPALRTDPFFATSPGPPPSYGSSAAWARSAVSLPPEAKVLPEKIDGPFDVYARRGHSANTSVGGALPPSVVLSPEAVDHIVQQLAQRIDRERERALPAVPDAPADTPVEAPEVAPEPAPREPESFDDAPPLYSSPPRLNIIFDHERDEPR